MQGLSEKYSCLLDNISCIDYATVVDEGLHIDAAKARRLLRQIVESGALHYSIHTRDQMIARRITVQDVEAYGQPFTCMIQKRWSAV